jgi:hypothetical protein
MGIFRGKILPRVRIFLEKIRGENMRQVFPQNILKGDKVTVHCQGETITGVVHSANNWGKSRTEPDWYIEFNAPDGPRYWKQGVDGGYLVAHEMENNI